MNAEVQQIIVWLIVAACVALVGKHIYRIFSNMGDNGNPCAHCSKGCAIHRAMEEKQCDCKKMHKKKKNCCCG